MNGASAFAEYDRVSRENGASIRAQTANNAEWVPGPKQTSLSPCVRVTQDIVNRWVMLLDQTGAVLEGRRTGFSSPWPFGACASLPP